MLAYYSWNEEWLRHTLEGKQSLCLPRTLVLEESAIWILQGHSLWQTNSRFFPFLLSMAKNENHMKRKRKTEHLVSTPFLPYSNKLFCDYCCHSPQSVHQWFSHLHESESPGGLIECAGPLPAFLMQLVHQGGGGESAFWSSSLVKLTRSAAGARVENCYPGKGEAQCSHCRGEETEPQDAEVLTRSYSSDRIQTQIFLDSGAPAISTIP